MPDILWVLTLVKIAALLNDLKSQLVKLYPNKFATISLRYNHGQLF